MASGFSNSNSETPLPDGTVVVTRKARFASSHFLSLPEHDEAENFDNFWKASWQPGHGHNYVVEAGVEGIPDPSTGMVINLRDLKDLLNEHAIEKFDFKHLNYEPAFTYRLPAIENIAAELWRTLYPELHTATTRLRWIAVSEMADLWGAIMGDDQMTQTFFTKVVHFCAGHRLFNPAWDDQTNTEVFGKCSLPNGHGHNYQLEVTVTGEPDERTGLIVDLGKLNTAVEGVAERLDHLNLNTDIPELTGVIPTTENVARVIWAMLAPTIPQPAQLYRIRLVETPNNAVEYFGPGVIQAPFPVAAAPV